MTERVSEEKIEALKKYIEAFPGKDPYGDFALYKKALLTLIDHSDSLSKSVSLVVRSRREAVALEHGSAYLFQPRHDGAGLRKYLKDNGFTGRYSHGTYRAGGKIVTYLCWLASGLPENIQYDDIPFGQGEDMTIGIVSPVTTEEAIRFWLNKGEITSEHWVCSWYELVILVCLFKERYPVGQVLLDGTPIKLDIAEKMGLHFLTDMECLFDIEKLEQEKLHREIVREACEP